MTDEPVLSFASKRAWAAWLGRNGAKSNGIWMEIAKKDSGDTSVTYQEALDVALCYGWIDGQRRGGEKTYFQRFTPRRTRSI